MVTGKARGRATGGVSGRNHCGRARAGEGRAGGLLGLEAMPSRVRVAMGSTGSSPTATYGALSHLRAAAAGVTAGSLKPRGPEEGGGLKASAVLA